MRRETQNILLLLLGGALLKISLNGDYLRYVKPSQLPWMFGAGVVLVLLAGIAAVRDVRAARRPAPDNGGEACHEHPARSAWLLLAPVLAVFLVAPPALGADSVTRAEDRQLDPAWSRKAEFPPLPPGRVVPLSLSEFASRAGWDANGTLRGRTVALTGFVVPDEKGVLLARMVIGCCAADAFPVTVRLSGGGAAGQPSDTWLRVTGQVVPGPRATGPGYVPELAVTALEPIPTPKDPYEY
ncbi:putative repeat protein (TIGR03943 family) [Prauserella shujinwangii]|uniref:Putative repeat protein (TIGR03943 family) n=1 Tax=Prauserella shujinwangii TaxID=1453103 RepID=A0A2T0LTR3_9PSEU|nr:TIGR03943 family protein [Prauserella shujinwangii]PRX47093.1 putative repeat protein (TIGR03943 family) [Prauserella shujinwangii]